MQVKVPTAPFSQRYLILYGALLASIIPKMVALEKVALGTFPLEIRLPAIFLPLAMVYRKPGIVAMTLACTAAHLVYFTSWPELAAAAFSALVGSYLAYREVRRLFTIRRLFAGCLIVSSVWILVTSVEWSLASGLPWTLTVAIMISRLFITINLLGFFLAYAVQRVLVHTIR